MVFVPSLKLVDWQVVEGIVATAKVYTSSVAAGVPEHPAAAK